MWKFDTMSLPPLTDTIEGGPTSLHLPVSARDRVNYFLFIKKKGKYKNFKSRKMQIASKLFGNWSILQVVSSLWTMPANNAWGWQNWCPIKEVGSFGLVSGRALRGGSVSAKNIQLTIGVSLTLFSFFLDYIILKSLVLLLLIQIFYNWNKKTCALV